MVVRRFPWNKNAGKVGFSRDLPLPQQFYMSGRATIPFQGAMAYFMLNGMIEQNYSAK